MRYTVTLEDTIMSDHPLHLLTLREVGEYLRVSRSTLMRLIRHGKLPSLLIGGSRRVRKSDLDDYIDQQGGSRGSSAS